MRVAVVTQMKQVELLDSPLEVARVVPEAVEQPVGVQTPALFPEEGQAAETTPEWRAEPRDPKTVGVHAVQMGQQHFRAEIHARPVFFRVIAENGQVRQ